MISSVWYLTIPQSSAANTVENNNSNNYNTFHKTNRKIIWRSNPNHPNHFPSMSILSSIIDATVDASTLSDISLQICKYAPIEAIPGILSCLICNYWRNDKGKINFIVTLTTIIIIILISNINSFTDI